MSNIRNPHEDAKQSKIELEEALLVMKKHFGSFKKVGRRQMYFVTPRKGAPCYILITSAPSNLKFDAVIKGIMKEYGSHPLYILFTRDVNTYPKSGTTYWHKVKLLYKKAGRSFKGAIMGLDELNKNVALQVMNGEKIQLTFNRYMDVTNNNVTAEQVLTEIAGLTPKKLKTVMSVLRAIKAVA
jgi:hypothetical protein